MSLRLRAGVTLTLLATVGMLLAPTASSAALRRVAASNSTEGTPELDAILKYVKVIPLSISSWSTNETYYTQAQYLLNNTGTESVCDIKFQVPVSNASQSYVRSSYAIDLHNTTSRAGEAGAGLEGVMPTYAQKLWPHQALTFGFILAGSDPSAVKLDSPVNITSARVCET